jgi:hypothetical protein
VKKQASLEWTTVKVSKTVLEDARRLRARLLRGGQACLPPALRKSILIPSELPSKLVDRKFGLGQIIQLSLEALALGVKDGK